MLTLPSSVRVFLAVEPVDMRGSFDALGGRVRGLGLDPQDGHLYVFVNRRRQLMKVLFFDRSGWCILAKRLEVGTFALPAVTAGETRLTIIGTYRHTDLTMDTPLSEALPELRRDAAVRQNNHRNIILSTCRHRLLYTLNARVSYALPYDEKKIYGGGNVRIYLKGFRFVK